MQGSAEVKGLILCDLLVWSGLIEDNDPRNPLQHEINTNRPAHSPFRLGVQPPYGSSGRTTSGRLILLQLHTSSFTAKVRTKAVVMQIIENGQSLNHHCGL